MAKSKCRYWLSFDADRATQPLIYQMGKKYDVVFNIRTASVSETMGLMAIELEGEREVLKQAIAWLEAQGVAVEPVEINTIEG
ncbi:MAG: NIL domain-containing protein [Methylacidiphilales bacterium]|nr:NIL domain-containing protein [Candidatus Methylacidiphilales bacterium]